jgi:hypothetical protein
MRRERFRKNHLCFKRETCLNLCRDGRIRGGTDVVYLHLTQLWKKTKGHLLCTKNGGGCVAEACRIEEVGVQRQGAIDVQTDMIDVHENENAERMEKKQMLKDKWRDQSPSSVVEDAGCWVKAAWRCEELNVMHVGQDRAMAGAAWCVSGCAWVGGHLRTCWPGVTQGKP